MSLWTVTPEFHLNRQTAILHSAAAAYVNRAWENTELVTDIQGLRIAERLGWGFCSNVLALDKFCPAHAFHVFALGKLHAQAIQQEPHAHIDFDVLCYHLPPRRWREARCGYQSIDEPDGYRKAALAGVLSYCNIGRGAPVNTGLVCWNDLDLRDEYVFRANRAAYMAARFCGDGLTVSLAAEQAVLGALLREKGVRGEALIPMASLADPADFADCAFTHLWSASKKDPRWAARVEERFRQEFPAKYEAATAGFALLEKRGFNRT